MVVKKTQTCSNLKLANWGLQNLTKIEETKVVPNWPKWGENWSEIFIDISIYNGGMWK